MNFEDKFQPFFFVKNGSAIDRIKILNEDLSLTLGDRRCIGHFSKGRLVDCPENRKIETGWNCNECRLSDDFFMCIRCEGGDCLNKKQRSSCEASKYYVYLAAFHSILKVGISHERRLMERLIEQGADFAAKIAEVTDGKEVRVLEQKIKKSLAITDKVEGDRKQTLIFGDPNIAMTNISRAIAYLQSNGVSKHLTRPEIYDLRSHYGLQNVLFQPTKLKPKKDDVIKGKAVAAKGNIIILHDGINFSCVNSHDLMGYDLEESKAMDTPSDFLIKI